MEFKLHNGSGGLCCKSCGRQDKQLNTYDWLCRHVRCNADESELRRGSVQEYPQRDITSTAPRYLWKKEI